MLVFRELDLRDGWAKGWNKKRRTESCWSSYNQAFAFEFLGDVDFVAWGALDELDGGDCVADFDVCGGGGVEEGALGEGEGEGREDRAEAEGAEHGALLSLSYCM